MKVRRPLVARVPIAAVVSAVAVAGLLTGCSSVVSLTPAPHANDVACANVIVRLPDTLEKLPRRETNAQATAAWGDPAEILLRCGVAVPTASTLPCVQTDDNFLWLRDATNAPNDVYTSYGRTPAVAVVIDQRTQSAGVVLRDLEPVIGVTTPNGRTCLSVQDSLGGAATSAPTPRPTPTPTPTR
ncbi:MAG: DUF3515 family protein [Acidobacteria bacterium]|nr:DUF3515 family protein [Acidobacteriota bacterium]